MDKARLIGIGLAALLLWACYGMRAPAAEICHTPTPQTLISWYGATYPQIPLRYSHQNSLIYHPIEVFQTGNPRVNWIGLAWLSPEWGALFAADCEGRPLAAVSVGAIGKIKAGPELPVLGQTVMFIYVDKETSDCVHDSAEIVALQDGKIISLWRHTYKQGMNAADPTDSHKSFITHNYAVTFGGDGQTIRVSGLAQEFAYRTDGTQSSIPSASKTLASETYRWNADSRRFVPAGKYSYYGVCAAGDLSIMK
jgi:hypothetical protein